MFLKFFTINVTHTILGKMAYNILHLNHSQPYRISTCSRTSIS
jgi:hypothetical protein